MKVAQSGLGLHLILHCWDLGCAPNTTLRGKNVEAVWTVPELQDQLDTWIVAGWQPRPHEGLARVVGDAPRPV